MAKNKKKTLQQTGIALRTSRSGHNYACYFDEANDFPSLKEAIASTCMELLEEMKVNPWELETHELLERITNFVNLHDAGSFEILEQYE